MTPYRRIKYCQNGWRHLSLNHVRRYSTGNSVTFGLHNPHTGEHLVTLQIVSFFHADFVQVYDVVTHPAFLYVASRNPRAGRVSPAQP